MAYHATSMGRKDAKGSAEMIHYELSDYGLKSASAFWRILYKLDLETQGQMWRYEANRALERIMDRYFT